MKQLVSKICIVCAVMIVAAGSVQTHADYDPRDDPNSPQSRAAAQKARAASAANKAKQDAANAAHKAQYVTKMAEMYRTLMQDKAKGLTDAQVVATFPAWQTEQNTIAQKGAADTYRRMLGDTAKGLSDKEVMTLVSDPKWQKQYQQDRLQNVGSMLANLSPEQRTAFEKNSGMSSADLEKKLQSAAVPKK
jgi:hypothetical protein